MIETLNTLLKNELDERLPSTVVEAMGYSLLSDGKRVRPLLLLNLLKDYGIEDIKGYYAAAAIECIHTYSLVHDDLPALDNDDFRRFKPTNHKVYGEDMAILAGDGLLTMAFSLLAKGQLDYRFTEILSRNAGVKGMILGQEIDIKDDITSLDELRESYELKTGALFSSSLEMASLIAKDDKNQANVSEIAKLLGIAFQFQDDLLEIEKTQEEIGKSSQSDTDRDIKTITSFLSLEDSKTLIDDIFADIDQRIDALNLKDNNLKNYISNLRNRKL